MLLLRSAVGALLAGLFLVASGASAHDGHHSHNDKIRSYTFDGRSPQHKKAFEDIVSHATKKLRRMRTRRNLKGLPGANCVGCINIDTYFTVFRSATAFQGINRTGIPNLRQPNPTDARRQFAILQNAFRGTPFSFTLKDVTIVQDEPFFISINSEEELEQVGFDYRKGTRETLNVYFGNAENGNSATFFPQIPVIGEDVYLRDGVVVDILRMPGVDNNPESSCCNQGLSLIKLVGHWLGLYNTFEDHGFDDPCDPENPNDYVEDTPQHLLRIDETTGDPLFDCPNPTPDTCTSDAGLDPIFNYMNIADDSCYREFSPGQIDRMYTIWHLFRRQRETCPPGQTLFSLEVTSDGATGELGWVLASTDGSLEVDDASLDFGSLFAYFDVLQNQTLSHDLCITTEQDYFFRIEDFGEDGLAQQGKYTVRLDGSVIMQGGVFTVAEIINFRGNRRNIVTDVRQITPPPTNAPTVAPSTSSFSFCFSGDNTVAVQGRGDIQMNELVVGDRVMVSEGKFEPVYSFGHRNENLKTDFLQLMPFQLEVSADHMVFVEGRGAIPASMIKVGDQLTNGQTVEAINTVVRTGVYTPYTPSGTIMVNGVKSSNYISFQGSDVFMLGSMRTPFNYHWMDNTFQSVHRLWCYWLGMEDTTLENGFSAWSEPPFKVAQWFVKQNTLVMGLVFAPFVIALFVLAVFESMLFNPMLALVALASSVYILRGKTRKQLA